MVTTLGIFLKCLRFLKGCLNAILQLSPHLQENLEKNTHTPDCFFEISWAKIFLKLFVYAIYVQL